MEMLKTRRGFILTSAVLLLIAAILYGYSTKTQDKYSGLKLIADVEISEDIKTAMRSRIAISEAAIKAQEKADEDVDLNLYSSIAWDATVLGDLVLARETYERYFELNSINHTAWNNYANILNEMGDFDRAEAAYKEAYTLYATEEFYTDYIEFIDRHSVDGNRDQDIKNALEEAVQEVGQTPYFMIRLANWYEERGECEQMTAHFKVAKTLIPESEDLDNEIVRATRNCATVNTD